MAPCSAAVARPTDSERIVTPLKYYVDLCQSQGLEEQHALISGRRDRAIRTLPGHRTRSGSGLNWTGSATQTSDVQSLQCAYEHSDYEGTVTEGEIDECHRWLLFHGDVQRMCGWVAPADESDARTDDPPNMATAKTNTHIVISTICTH